MRSIKSAPGEYYHIYGRGNDKQPIFIDDHDRGRLLFSLLTLQSPLTVTRPARKIKALVQHSVLDIPAETLGEICVDRYVEMLCFAFMPNHYHLLIREHEEGGISRYMQRVLNGYTKYFHVRHGTSGHLLQGPYGITHLENDTQFRHVSAYIHRNPREITGWAGKEHVFPWSSFQDYIKENRWGGLLNTETISSFFGSGDRYKEFVDTSTAKANLTKMEIF